MESSCNECSTSQPEVSEAIEGQDQAQIVGEYRKFSDEIHEHVVKERIPLNGGIEIIENCNFRCIHCYQGMNKNKKVLSFEKWKNIADQLSDMGTLWLLLTGGEPLLHPEFEKIYTYLIKKGFLMNFFTNGRLLTEKHMDLIQDLPPFQMEISLYGFSEETYRKVTGTKGSFEKVISNCRELARRGIPLKVKTVVMKPLLHEVAAMKSFAEEELGSQFKMDFKIDPGIYGDDFSEIRLDHEERNNLEDQFFGINVLEEDFRMLSEYRKKHIEKYKKLDQRLYTCGAGKNSFYIDYQGWVHPCSIDRVWDEKFDLDIYSFKDIWENRMPPLVYQKVKDKNAECQSCEYRSICDMCPATAKLATGNREGRPMYICKATMERKKRLLEYEQEKKEVSHAVES